MVTQHDAFATFVATLGRGPGRSRALTRAEARAAFGMVLRREADPHQIGAFLMLLRFRGEDAEEIAGLTEAARDQIDPPATADLDWPSYGSGRTRGAPWFLLAALALSRTGATVLMHGSNEHSAGISVEAGLHALGLEPGVPSGRFQYLPLARLSPRLDELLGMRRLFGLRSPVNTVARLLNPANAAAGVDGVFHPAYLAVHLGVAQRMGRQRLLVLKGGGGEAERVPLKSGSAWLWDREIGQAEIDLPAVPGLAALTPSTDTTDLLTAVWRGTAAPPTVITTIVATIQLGLQALGWSAAEADAARVWRGRLPA